MNPTDNETDRFPLDEETAELVADYRRQVAMLESRMGGALDLFSRRHKLQGAWSLAPNLKELVRADALRETVRSGADPGNGNAS